MRGAGQGRDCQGAAPLVAGVAMIRQPLSTRAAQQAIAQSRMANASDSAHAQDMNDLLDLRIVAAEAELVAIDGRVDAAEAGLVDHETRIDALEAAPGGGGGGYPPQLGYMGW